MNAKLFDKPVYVRNGSYLVQEIAGVEDAIDFLERWPKRKRDTIHERALATCYAALDGRRPSIAAYISFTGFAKRADILEDFDAVVPWHIANRSPGRSVPV